MPAAIRDARAAGHRRTAAGMARTAKRTPDLRAEKVVSHRYGFVWIANPKVASNSILEALLGADPTARAVRYVTLAELYAAMPETRDYVSFAFVRHPYARTRSCHASKLHARTPAIARRYHGLRPGLGIDDFCAWLATPWGSDAFADRHWLSQSVLLRENACSPLPDFIGRCESLDADLRAVADRLRMPTPGLARRNRSPAWRIPGPNAHSRMLLAQRYAEDFALGGYDR